MAVKQVSTSSALWHDLGVAYMRRSAHAQVTSDATGARQLMTQAVTCLRKSLSVDSRNAVAWNSLGLAAASKGSFNPSLSPPFKYVCCFDQTVTLLPVQFSTSQHSLSTASSERSSVTQQVPQPGRTLQHCTSTTVTSRLLTRLSLPPNRLTLPSLQPGSAR